MPQVLLTSTFFVLLRGSLSMPFSFQSGTRYDRYGYGPVKISVLGTRTFWYTTNQPVLGYRSRYRPNFDDPRWPFTFELPKDADQKASMVLDGRPDVKPINENCGKAHQISLDGATNLVHQPRFFDLCLRVVTFGILPLFETIIYIYNIYTIYILYIYYILYILYIIYIYYIYIYYIYIIYILYIYYIYSIYIYCLLDSRAQCSHATVMPGQILPQSRRTGETLEHKSCKKMIFT